MIQPFDTEAFEQAMRDGNTFTALQMLREPLRELMEAASKDGVLAPADRDNLLLTVASATLILINRELTRVLF